jgi:hypothetical protein
LRKTKARNSLSTKALGTEEKQMQLLAKKTKSSRVASSTLSYFRNTKEILKRLVACSSCSIWASTISTLVFK